MTEYIYRPLRNGKRARLYSGRYCIARGDKPRTVYLGTPDKVVARKRLRDIIVQAQREAEGIIAPAAQREAAGAMLSQLLADYLADLAARGRSEKHARDTGQRVGRLLKDTGWTRLKDIRADQFVKWRATLTVAAKTAKEYQAAAVAWLNWLVQLGCLAVNPLGKLPAVATRGKQVRIARALTLEELSALFAVATPERRLVYQVLAYTGQRRTEVRSLVRGDLHLDGDRPHALFRAETMKDREKRAVPLHPELAAVLRARLPAEMAADAPVFESFPKWKTLLRDLERAGIARRDGVGRVLHFHSFRKTFQTLGVRHGINQRAAQELLGHSDANLTAKVYTDVPALGLHSEVAKLPWLGAGGGDAALIRIPESVRPAAASRFESLLRELVVVSKSLSESDLLSLPEIANGAANGIRTVGLGVEGVDGVKLAKASKSLAALIRTLSRAGGRRK